MNINKEKIRQLLVTTRVQNETILCSILREYRSDKSSDWHNYGPIYNYFFQDLVGKGISLFEVGIFNGSSARAWKQYFHNAQVYLADINVDYFLEDFPCYLCNQDEFKSIKHMWENPSLRNVQFEIIIDDGKHTFLANWNFFRASFHKLKNNGFFVIEDLTKSTVILFTLLIPYLRIRYGLRYVKVLRLKNGTNNIDNNLFIALRS
jgi:hypothetical protein